MKKWLLVLLTLVPILAGYLIDVTALVPVVGELLFYLLPLIVVAFWFWLGGQYAGTDWGAAASILIGSATGILSLAVYLWQFVVLDSQARSMVWAGFSQLYASAAPIYLVAMLARLFPAGAAVTALEVLALLLMTGVFAGGYFWRKRHPPRAK